MSGSADVPRLNRRLVLEALERVSDGSGGYAQVWVARGVIWAAMVPGTGRAEDQGAVIRAQVAWRITVRAAPAGAPQRPRPEERLREGARIFTILAVAERDVAGRYLVLFAREEVAS